MNIPVLLFASLLSTGALADTTIAYRIDGECRGDFDQIQLKSHWLRADSHQGSYGSSMIYDGVEKIAYFVDHRARNFMQTEMDEDAIDLQADVMASLGKKMRHESGVDPFAMAEALCPGMNVDSRDRLPDEPVDCGNGRTIGATGADGKAVDREQMAAMMKGAGVAGLGADSQELMQKMMEQMSASLTPEQQAQMQSMMASGGAAMPAGTAAAPRAPRIDRDAGEARVGEIACLRRQHLRGEEMLGEDCLAPVAGLKLGEIETRRLARFSKTLQEWSSSIAPGQSARARAADDRVLVQRTCYRGGRESGHATLTLDRAPIADSRFAVPEGYALLDPMQGLQDGRHPR